MNISIITNWGCYFNCPYCVWKSHPLRDINGPSDRDKLQKFLVKHQVKGKVSVSGGGDPLYKYDEHKEWWDWLFKLCDELHLMVDVHTRTVLYDNAFWKKIHRAVISSDHPDDVDEYAEWLRSRTQVRITHVVTKETTTRLMEDYLELCFAYGCQMTFKQLYGGDDGGNFNRLKERFKHRGVFLPHGDYNIYYMPNDTVTECFIGA